MTTLYGPTDTAVPDAYTSPSPTSYDETLVTFLGPWLMRAGDVVTVSWTAAARTLGGPGFDVYLKDIVSLANTWAGSFGGALYWAVVSGANSFSLTVPHDGTFYVALLNGGGGLANGGGIGTLYGFNVDTSGSPPGAFCAGGTTRKDTTTDLVIIGGTAADAIAIYLGGPWVEFFALLVNAVGVHVLSTSALCSGPPGPMPVITQADFQALSGASGAPTADQIARFWIAVQVAAWPYFCQCAPGTGGTPPPAPVAPSITIALPPAVTCDQGDLCAMLDAIVRKIDDVSLQVQFTRRDVTLIQRQRVPFGYLPGQIHSGLTGNGHFAVDGILGIAVQVTTVPGYTGETSGDPVARFELGWIASGTPDGWRISVPIRHNPQWVDVEGDDTLIGYSLNPLVVANIEEFVREP